MEIEMEWIPKFIEQFKKGNLVLLLGQNHLSIDTASDLFLKKITEKFNIQSQNFGYFKILDSKEILEDRELSLTWMSNLSRKISIPLWLTEISNIKWASVFTTSIDDTMDRVLRNDWRNIKPIYTNVSVTNLRNPYDLHVYKLFGCVDQIESMKIPPLTSLELQIKKQTALNLLQRIQEIVTNNGLLIIEGYDINTDWLNIQDIYGVLFNLLPFQIHLFSAHKSYEENPYIKDLISTKKLVLHNESFNSFLNSLSIDIDTEISNSFEDEQYGRWVNIGEQKIRVPMELRNRVIKSAMIIDNEVLKFEKFSSAEEKYNEFRSFIAGNLSMPKWLGYQHGFAFQREFKFKISNLISKFQNKEESKKNPIIVYGQASSGKTIILGKIAYEFAKDLGIPVLFIERKYSRIDESNIDAYCEWVESKGANYTLIIWDGMQDEEHYFKVQRNLEQRGRNIILIGTIYKKEDDKSKSNYNKENYIEAPIELTEKELVEFGKYLNSNIPNSDTIPGIIKNSKEKNFLAVLYQYLPLSQKNIQSGLSTEANFFSSWIINSSKSEYTEITSTSRMTEILKSSGLINEDYIEEKMVSQFIANENFEIPDYFINIIMVPGRYGLKVPFDLVLRCLNLEMLNTGIFKKLREINLIKWYQDEIGNIFIGPRTSFEANLLVRNLGNERTIAGFICNILSKIKNSNAKSNDYDNSIDEVEFAVQLLYQVGPNSNHGLNTQYLYDITKVLQNLRETKQASSARLVLQEATYLREIAKSNTQFFTTETPLQILERAEIMVQDEIEKLSGKEKTNIYSYLRVELASILGAKINYKIKHKEPVLSVVSLYNYVKDQLIEDRNNSPVNFHALDVLFWTTESLINENYLNEFQKIEAEADLLHQFELAEVEGISDNYKNVFESRKYKLGELIKDEIISQQAFDNLLKNGSAAGFYLKAKSILDKNGIIDLRKPVDNNKTIIEEAIGYLEENYSLIKNDGRTLYMYFTLWWLRETELPLFYEEKQQIKFTKEKWDKCLTILVDLYNLKIEDYSTSLKFLRGLALFHLGLYKESFEVFKELDNESEQANIGKRRIVKSFIASSENGPIKYVGQVKYAISSLNNQQKGQFLVKEIRQEIPFRLNDFKIKKVEADDIKNIYISFNFRGPLAIPETFL